MTKRRQAQVHKVSEAEPPKAELPSSVNVGSFFLETLTTGMYQEPFDSIREYIQNAFDAILDATNAGVIRQGEGRVAVRVDDAGDTPSITVHDNGVGIRGSDAIQTLLSLGASTKRPNKHAGFRGIGRLAGIAYCTTLRFRTKAAGEEYETTLEFDCSKLRGFMRMGANPIGISEAILQCTSAFTEKKDTALHYTDVEMVGLTGRGREFADSEQLLSYLSQYAPVDYDSSFNFADRIRAYAKKLNHTIPVIPVSVEFASGPTFFVTKPYRDSYRTSQAKISELFEIQEIGGSDRGWFGWIGLSNFPGEIAEKEAAGIRFRARNIQIGDASILEEITRTFRNGSEDKSAANRVGSDRRLQRYAVGEIFITDPGITPNARRDNFEDTPEWRNIQKEMAMVGRQVVTAVRSRSTQRAKLKAIKTKLNKAAEKTSAGMGISKQEAEEIDELLKEQLDSIKQSINDGADRKEARELLKQANQIREDLDKTKRVKAPRPPASLRGVIMRIVQAVLTKSIGKRQATELMGEINKKLDDAAIS